MHDLINKLLHSNGTNGGVNGAYDLKVKSYILYRHTHDHLFVTWS